MAINLANTMFMKRMALQEREAQRQQQLQAMEQQRQAQADDRMERTFGRGMQVAKHVGSAEQQEFERDLKMAELESKLAVQLGKDPKQYEGKAGRAGDIGADRGELAMAKAELARIAAEAKFMQDERAKVVIPMAKHGLEKEKWGWETADPYTSLAEMHRIRAGQEANRARIYSSGRSRPPDPELSVGRAAKTNLYTLDKAIDSTLKSLQKAEDPENFFSSEDEVADLKAKLQFLREVREQEVGAIRAFKKEKPQSVYERVGGPVDWFKALTGSSGEGPTGGSRLEQFRAAQREKELKGE